MSKVTIEAVDNGYIVTGEEFAGKTRVFRKIEEVLLEVYQSVCPEWSVGDRVTVKKAD